MARTPPPPRRPPPPAWALNRYGDVRPSLLRALVGRALRWFIAGAEADDEWQNRRAAERVRKQGAI